MATSGRIEEKYHNDGYSLILDWTESNIDIDNNTSDITVVAKLKSNGSSYNINSTATKTITMTINGTKYSGTCTVGLSGGATKTLMTKTVTIAHTTSGSKTISLSCELGIAVTLSGIYYKNMLVSGTAQLTTIPRKSTLTVGNGTLGTAQTLTVKKQASAFTHTITYKCGSASGTICTKSSATSISFTPPISLASQNTSGTSVSVVYTIVTYNGTTNIGSNSYTKSCTIPSSVVPTVAIAVTDSTGYADTYGKYVQCMSKAKVVVTASGVYGSTIKAYSTKIDGKTYTGSTFTSDPICASGDVVITTTITDSRGRTATTSKTISIYKYVSPYIDGLYVRRVNEAGDDDEQGAYIQLGGFAYVSHLGYHVEPTVVIEYKKSTETTYTNLTLTLGETGYVDEMVNAHFSRKIEADPSFTYEVRVNVSDDFKRVSKSVSVPSAKKFFSFLKQGLGIAFGKIAELEDVFEIAFKTKLTGGIVQPVLPDGTDFDDILIANTYTLKSVSDAEYVNAPITAGTGILKVETCGDEGQTRQVVIACSKTNPVKYERYYYQSSWGEWLTM